MRCLKQCSHQTDPVFEPTLLSIPRRCADDESNEIDNIGQVTLFRLRASALLLHGHYHFYLQRKSHWQCRATQRKPGVGAGA